MSLVVGVNSWVTIAEADAYFLYKYGASVGWAALDNATKESLLISGYRWIMSDPSVTISATSTAQNVKDAQCEAAWYIYKYWGGHEKRLALQAQGVKEFNISKFSEEFTGEGGLPKSVSDLLEDSKLSGFAVVTRDLD